jgi:hypothetical protein
MVENKIASEEDIERSLQALLSEYGYSEEDVHKIINKSPVSVLLRLAREESMKEHGAKWAEFYYQVHQKLLSEGLEKNNLGE